MLGLAKDAVHGLDDGRFHGRGAEVVVEDGLADDVERYGAEALFHVHDGVGRCLGIEVVDEPIGAVGEEAHHAIEPSLVKAGNDGPATDLPRGRIGGDKALAHDGLQDFGQHALAVLLRGALAQYLAGHDGVAHNEERFGPEAQVEDGPVVLIVLGQQASVCRSPPRAPLMKEKKDPSYF